MSTSGLARIQRVQVPALTAYDQAEMTSIAASHIAFELLALIAKSGE